MLNEKVIQTPKTQFARTKKHKHESMFIDGMNLAHRGVYCLGGSYQLRVTPRCLGSARNNTVVSSFLTMAGGPG
jgi:hypothetical protein